MLSTLMVTVLSQAAIPAAEPGEDVFGWLISAVKWSVEQFQSKNYLPACGMIIMLLVWALKKFLGDKLKAAKLALLAAGLGVLSSMGMELAGLAMGSSKFDVLRALANGLMVGAASSGMWSLLGKKFMGKKEEAPPAEAPKDEAPKSEAPPAGP